MTRSDLVTALADRFPQLVHRDAESAVNIILGAMTDSLVRGERVEIRGFGSFSLKQRAARIGRNPRSDSAVNIPPDVFLTSKLANRCAKALIGDLEQLTDASEQTDPRSAASYA